MARNTVPLIIGAVIFGLLAIGLTIFTVFSGGGGSAPGTTSAEAEQPAGPAHFAALRPIYPRTIITRDMLEEREAGGEVPPGAITSLNDIVGRLANRTIQAGQIITSETLTSPIARVIPANIPVPTGLRAVAVWVDRDQTVAGLIDVGDRVDVIVTHDLMDNRTQEEGSAKTVDFTAGRTVAQDLEVLAVHRSIEEYRETTPPPTQQPGEAGQAGADGAAAPPPPPPPPAQPNQVTRIRVILAAPPETAQRLVTADEKGRLHLTIRNASSRDRFAITEAREYANRIPTRPTGATQPAPAPAGGGTAGGGGGGGTTGGGGGGGTSGGGRAGGSAQASFPPPEFRSPPSLPPAGVMPPPAPGQGTTNDSGTESSDKEVTVIRGTEKTRVIVPQ